MNMYPLRMTSKEYVYPRAAINLKAAVLLPSVDFVTARMFGWGTLDLGGSGGARWTSVLFYTNT